MLKPLTDPFRKFAQQLEFLKVDKGIIQLKTACGHHILGIYPFAAYLGVWIWLYEWIQFFLLRLVHLKKHLTEDFPLRDKVTIVVAALVKYELKKRDVLFDLVSRRSGSTECSLPSAFTRKDESRKRRCSIGATLVLPFLPNNQNLEEKSSSAIKEEQRSCTWTRSISWLFSCWFGTRARNVKDIPIRLLKLLCLYYR